MNEESALLASISGFLGRGADDITAAGPTEAASIAEEFLASVRATDALGTVVSQRWPQRDIQEIVDTLHRVSRNLGSRPVWLIVSLSEPHAIAMASDIALDNPLGFAGLGDHELQLLDRELPAGLWLIRPSGPDGSTIVEYTWELSAWGEPWGSATTRALRGIG
jgi:hypothetical protein